jgi:hypothetical protein
MQMSFFSLIPSLQRQYDALGVSAQEFAQLLAGAPRQTARK